MDHQHRHGRLGSSGLPHEAAEWAEYAIALAAERAYLAEAGDVEEYYSQVERITDLLTESVTGVKP